MSEGARIRLATPADLRALDAIERSGDAMFVEVGHPEFDGADTIIEADGVQAIADQRVWVVEADGELAGFVLLGDVGDELAVKQISVSPVFGRRGIGRALMRHVMTTTTAPTIVLDTQADVVIIDTAGRLHTKVNLMNELTKIKRVMQKFIPEAPHEILLVLDGSTGQNAFLQAKEFTKATEVSSLAITKLDGTAKGGVVIGISDQFKMPVKCIGVGEGIEDLQVFNKFEFVDSFFK